MTHRWVSFLCAAALAVATTVRADDKPKPQGTNEQAEGEDTGQRPVAASEENIRVVGPARVIEVKNKQILTPCAPGFLNVLSVYPVKVRIDDRLGAVIVAGTPEVVAAAEETIRRLDVPEPPSRDVEVVVDILLAQEGRALPASVPPSLQDVVQQLKAVFAYTSYSLLETAVIRARESARTDPQIGGALRLGPSDRVGHPDRVGHYNMRLARPKISSDDRGPVVAFDTMSFIAYGVMTSSANAAALITGFSVHQGQSVVVGKTAIDQGKSALILVFSAKIVE